MDKFTDALLELKIAACACCEHGTGLFCEKCKIQEAKKTLLDLIKEALSKKTV